MASLVDSIMQQLLSKDVLYQPMKVGGVMPLYSFTSGQGPWGRWLEATRTGVHKEDMERHRRFDDRILCMLAPSL